MPIWSFGFGPFTLDLAAGELLRDGRALPVTARDLAVLRHLVVRAGQVASTDEILESVWADTFVVRGVVKTSVHRLRAAIGDTRSEATYIETVGRRGYRFVADLRSDSGVGGDALNHALPVPRIERLSPASVRAREAPAVREPLAARLRRMPFVGRGTDLAVLVRGLDATRAGSGRIAFVVGEPGIGKTRLLEEFAAHARAAGACVLAGRCNDGELARPYGPFAEAMAAHATASDDAALREDLSSFGGIVARIAPELRAKLPDLPEPVPLSLEEQRPRIVDAVAQILWTIARRTPLVLVLDDLHWADGATLAMLRHVARFLPRHPVFVVGAYRDLELDRQHPLSQVLVELRRDLDVERAALTGLDRGAIAELVAAVAAGEATEDFIDALVEETAGNPLFLRELLLHLHEQGTLGGANARSGWRVSLDETGAPEGVRDLIGRRLSGLSDGTNRLLATASGHGGPFWFEVAAAASGLDQDQALDALDEAVHAQLVRKTSESETYEFTHAMIRHTLYGDISAPRRVRLHRRLAEELERVVGSTPSSAIEIARHYQRSKSLPGAERGADHALLAAAHAEQQGALEEAAESLRIALELLPEVDPRRPRATSRLVLALAWSMRSEEALALASDAAALLGSSEGASAAAEFLALLAQLGGFENSIAWGLARQGLVWAGNRRDVTWAILRSFDLDRQDAEDPNYPGMLLDTPDRQEAWLLISNSSHRYKSSRWGLFSSGAEALAMPSPPWYVVAAIAGDLRGGLHLIREELNEHLRCGRILEAARGSIHVPRLLAALGDFDESAVELARSVELCARAGLPPTVHHRFAEFEFAYVRGEDLGYFAPMADYMLQAAANGVQSLAASVHCTNALAFAFAGRGDDALCEVAALLPAVERASGGVDGYTGMICSAVAVLWTLQRTDFADVLERNLRAKTIEPDFRLFVHDARRAMGMLCALTNRFDEAREWFARARTVLEEQGARPLRALIDYDEAEMELRRGASGNRARALALLELAGRSFESIGMTGWLRRADELRQTLAPAHPA